jgi:hypothetical protein
MTRKVLPLILAVAVLLGTGQQSHAGWWKRNWWKVAAAATIVGIPLLFGGDAQVCVEDKHGNEICEPIHLTSQVRKQDADRARKANHGARQQRQQLYRQVE